MSLSLSSSTPASVAADPVVRRLRRVLLADASVCAVLGLLLVDLAATSDEPAGIPAGPLGGIGAVLLLGAVAVAAIGVRAPHVPAAVALVGGVNLAWAAGSVLLAEGIPWTPTTGGVALILAQGAAAIAFGAVELVGVRRLRRAAAAPRA